MGTSLYRRDHHFPNAYSQIRGPSVWNAKKSLTKNLFAQRRSVTHDARLEIASRVLLAG